MTIDELLERHPAPWKWWDDQPFTWFDSNGNRVGTHVAYQILFNAYAALKSEADNLRACVKAADELSDAVSYEDKSLFKLASAYDAARAKVKP